MGTSVMTPRTAARAMVRVVNRHASPPEATTTTAKLLALCRLPDLAHAALAEQGGDVVVPEAGAGTEGHELLSLLTELVYAQAVNGSSLRVVVKFDG